MSRIYTDTRDASGGAVGAANAYKEIVTAIGSAMDAAERAVNASMDALEKVTANIYKAY